MKKADITANENIASETILLVGEGGAKKVPLKKALSSANEVGLDIIQVSMQKGIPVCKIGNLDKYLYDQKKRQKEQKKKQKEIYQETKEIRISSSIDVGDVNTKARQASRFLEKNKKVKLSLSLRGRESKEFGMRSIENFLNSVEYPFDNTPIVQDGRIIQTTLSPKQ